MMTQQLASSTPIEGLLDFGPKATSEATVEGNPFSQLLAQFTESTANEGNTSARENGVSPELARIASVAILPLEGAEGSDPATDGEPAVKEADDANGDAAMPETPELPLLAALIPPTLPSQTEAAPAKLNVGPLQQPQVVTPATLTPMPVMEATRMAQDPSRAGENLSVALDALLPGVQKGKERVSAPRTAAATVQASESLLTSPDPNSTQSDLSLPATGREAQMQALLDGMQPASVPLMPAADTAAGSVNTDVAKLDTASPSQQLVERHLDLAREGQWLDRLARDIAHSGGSDGSLSFRLNPEHLGSLHVELTQGAAGASLRLTADTEAARAILADAQPRLVAEARAQGVKIAETHVDLGGRDQSFQDQSFQGQSFAGDQRGARHSRGEEYLTTFQPEPFDGAVKRHHTARHASDRYA